MIEAIKKDKSPLIDYSWGFAIFQFGMIIILFKYAFVESPSWLGGLRTQPCLCEGAGLIPDLAH